MTKASNEQAGGSSGSGRSRERAVELLELARGQTRDARPREARSTLQVAGSHAILGGDLGLLAEIWIVASRADAVLDRLMDATDSAKLAVLLLAHHPVLAGGRLHRQAYAQLAEVYELRGLLRYAAMKFELLIAELEPVSDWAIHLLLNSANHLLSEGAKLGDRHLAERGRKLALPLLDRASDGDERSSVMQWDAIERVRVGEVDEAFALWQDSLADRSSAPSRMTTRPFPESHMLAGQGRLEESAEVLKRGIIGARAAWMLRYVRAGLTLRVELGLSELINPTDLGLT